MHLRSNILTLGVLLLLGIRHTTAEEKKQSNSLWSSNTKDDIYIDDDDLEGSGQREIKDDLESSGSGFGPDDEDGDGGSDMNLHKVTQVKTSVQPPQIPVEKEPINTKTSVNNVESANPSGNNNIGGSTDLDTDLDNEDSSRHGNDVYIMNTKHEERATSFFAQPGILAAVIGGAVVGLLCAILVVMFIVYRMRKKDEGSYALEEPKRSPTANSYTKNSNREFYA